MNKHSSKQFINSLANETKSPLLVFRPTNTVAVFSLLELKLRTILSDWGYQFIYEESCYIYNSQLLTGRERCFIDFCFFSIHLLPHNQFISDMVFYEKKKSIKNLWSSQNKSMYQMSNNALNGQIFRVSNVIWKQSPKPSLLCL